MRTLDKLVPGQRARVVGVNGGDPISQRLMEMGMIAGSTVEVIKFAPLGDPMELRLQGTHLSVRKSEAARVQVAPCL